MAKIVIKQGEAKTLTFTVKDAVGAPVNLSAATLLLGVKLTKEDVAYAFSVTDANFGKSLAATGVVTVVLSAANTNRDEGDYIGELKCTWGTVVKKSDDFSIQIKKAVTA